MSVDRYTITDQNACYFLTFTIVDWADVFIRPSYKQIIVDALIFTSDTKASLFTAGA